MKKGLNRWIMLVVIVLAGIAVAVDYVRYHGARPDAQGGLPLPEGGIETGGYGAASDDTDDE